MHAAAPGPRLRSISRTSGLGGRLQGRPMRWRSRLRVDAARAAPPVVGLRFPTRRRATRAGPGSAGPVSCRSPRAYASGWPVPQLTRARFGRGLAELMRGSLLLPTRRRGDASPSPPRPASSVGGGADTLQLPEPARRRAGAPTAGCSRSRRRRTTVELRACRWYRRECAHISLLLRTGLCSAHADAATPWRSSAPLWWGWWRSYDRSCHEPAPPASPHIDRRVSQETSLPGR